jgi:NAD(P)-dependent dehydrogenase (short-subunit alcohol dehydrogenase family)
MSYESLQGRVAVIIGASSGIGASVARALAHEGAHVALAARRRDVLLDVQTRLGRQRSQVRTLVVPTDITDRQQVKSLVARTEEELGPVDILVNCAGVMYYTVTEYNHVVGVLQEVKPMRLDPTFPPRRSRRFHLRLRQRRP